jgi:hypothetical protein
VANDPKIRECKKAQIMNRTLSVPKKLLEMALAALPEQLAVLRKCRAANEDYVWAFFDGRVIPGRRLAMIQLCGAGATPQRAATQVDRAIKDARAQGKLFALGVMATTEEFPRLLRSLAGDEIGVGTIAAWLAAPLPPRWFRVAAISGPATQVQTVSIDSLRRPPR